VVGTTHRQGHFLSQDRPVDKDTSSHQPTLVGAKVADVQPRLIAPPGSPSVGESKGIVSMAAVCEPTEGLVLQSLSLEPVTMLPSAQVVMIQCISYVECHKKVVKFFKMKPPKVAALEMCPKGPVHVCFRQKAHLAAKCHKATINPKLLDPHHRLPPYHMPYSKH
jgi:hypothetical protein